VKQIPDRANGDQQEAYKTETLEPLVEQAQRQEIELFFVDAAHFVLLPFLGYLYSLTVRFLRSTSGRRRFSVLGALNAVTHELVSITDHAYINADSVCALLEKLRETCCARPIVLVMDNVRYQKCARVLETALRLNIRLEFLPPYSPNLNLIERLWKFVKKEVLYNKFYSDYAQFTTAIMKCLNETHTTHREALKTLLTPRFQTFERWCFQC
jgi:transposase